MVNIKKLKIFDVITTMDEYLLLKQHINVGHSIYEYKKYKRCQLTIKYFFKFCLFGFIKNIN